MDDLTTEQKLLILNKAIERFRSGEVPNITRSYRFVFEGHFAGGSYEDSLRYTLDLRHEKPVFSTYSYHFKLSTAVTMDDFCEIYFVEIAKFMLDLNTFGTDISQSVAYQNFLAKAT